MTTSGYLEFSRLWQEQADPLEQATLRTLANDIERTARRRRAIDFALALFATSMVLLALIAHPAPMTVRLTLAAAIGLVGWTVWKRQQFLQAARALVLLEPRAFFPAAIANARAELNYSTFSLFLAAPAGFLIFILLNAPHAGGVVPFVAEMLGVHMKKTIALAAIMLPVYGFYIPANGRLREQVRRLEAMSRDWEAEDVRDLPDRP